MRLWVSLPCLLALFCLNFVSCQPPESAESPEGVSEKTGEVVEMGWPRTPEVGALRLRFRLEGIRDTFDLPTRAAGETAQVILLDTPLFQANLNVEPTKTNLHVLFHAEGAENGPWVTSGLERLQGVWNELPRDQIKAGVFETSHLRGNQWYDLVLLWNLPERDIRVVLNGIEQGDLFPASKGDWTPSPKEDRPARAGGILTGTEVSVPISMAAVELIEGQPSAETLKAWAAEVPPLVNEARVEFAEAMEVNIPKNAKVRTTDGETVRIVAESALFDAEQSERLREPSADEWVLEGPGRATFADGVLTMENLPAEGEGLAATAQRGHQVLWIPWELTENFLLEYEFTPEDSLRGLHIIFWNARGPEGKSIFDLEVGGGFRDGVFSEYLWRTMRSYHASVFATDDTTPRRTANLRKNPGFVLVACGEDAIAGHGAGPFRVRLLREENRMQIEVDGRKVMEFEDDARANREPHEGGIFGFRIMSHTGSAQFANIRLTTWGDEKDRESNNQP